MIKKLLFLLLCGISATAASAQYYDNSVNYISSAPQTTTNNEPVRFGFGLDFGYAGASLSDCDMANGFIVTPKFNILVPLGKSGNNYFDLAAGFSYMGLSEMELWYKNQGQYLKPNIYEILPAEIGFKFLLNPNAETGKWYINPGFDVCFLALSTPSVRSYHSKYTGSHKYLEGSTSMTAGVYVKVQYERSHIGYGLTPFAKYGVPYSKENSGGFIFGAAASVYYLF